jgi:hypothetical protein
VCPFTASASLRASLGEKIGEGGLADVHAWAPGQVVKLFRTGMPQRVAWHEARMTRAVFAAGFPAPEVLDEVTLEGRFGIVLPRLNGPTLLELSRTGAMTSEQVGSILGPSPYPFTGRPRRPRPCGLPHCPFRARPGTRR